MPRCGCGSHRAAEAAEKINRYQRRGAFHPLTCGNCGMPERNERPLVASNVGPDVVLTCPLGCGYRQVMDADLIENVVSMADMPTWQESLAHHRSTATDAR